MSDAISPFAQHCKALEAAWFASAEQGIKDTYVYRYYDADDRLLYVGQTQDFATRHKAHKTRPWFKDAVRHEVDGPFAKQIALGREFCHIQLHEPLHNRARQNGYLGPASRAWQQAMSDEFGRLMSERHEIYQAEMDWISSAMSEFYRAHGLEHLAAS